MKKIPSFTAYFDGCLDNTSYKNRVGRNIESSTSEIEETIEMKLDNVTADYTKIIDSFDMKTSDITSKKFLHPINRLLLISSNGFS